MAELIKVLLVDDYEVNLELLEAYLELSELPLKILKATNGAEAYQCIAENKLDLILLDVMLPDTDGYEICRMLKGNRAYQTIPVLMITALHDKESMLKGLAAGADEFLTKPVDKHELLLRVKNLLRLKMITNDLDARYQQLHKELLLATELQKTFLPQKLPNLMGVTLDVLYKPSSFIGGDFYDFLFIDEDHLGILICDVKGHGVASAMITATVKFQLSSLHADYLYPEKVLTNLNECLYQFFAHTANDFFVTAFYGVLELSTKKFVYSNAGHNEPLLCMNNQSKFLTNEAGLPLGIFSGANYEQTTWQLNSNDHLFLYTDGILELPLGRCQENICTDLQDFFSAPEEICAGKLKLLEEEIKHYVEKHQISDDVNYIALTLA